MDAIDNPTDPANCSSLRDELERLLREHRDLDETIAEMRVSPPEDELLLRRLKKRKLLLKDSIVALERQLDPDEYA
ncbi:MAG: DUF465 domain-containing protein [Rhodocyclaceae bacterium]|jgi:hypothetical protein|nr:DUF465 domain-containing protein [Rhodocyclaceae bacterium]MBK6907021.1 DUF465 domain-containing protein [Rhodocyclaceae bacterium]